MTCCCAHALASPGDSLRKPHPSERCMYVCVCVCVSVCVCVELHGAANKHKDTHTHTHTHTRQADKQTQIIHSPGCRKVQFSARAAATRSVGERKLVVLWACTGVHPRRATLRAMRDAHSPRLAMKTRCIYNTRWAGAGSMLFLQRVSQLVD